MSLNLKIWFIILVSVYATLAVILLSKSSSSSAPPTIEYFEHTFKKSTIAIPKNECNINGSDVLYSNIEFLENGDALYTNTSLSILAPNGFYAENGTNKSFEITNGNGKVSGLATCVFTYTFSKNTNALTACNGTPLQTLHSTDAIIANNSILYLDISLALLAEDGWYSIVQQNTSIVFEIKGGNGVVTGLTNCA